MVPFTMRRDGDGLVVRVVVDHLWTDADGEQWAMLWVGDAPVLAREGDC